MQLIAVNALIYDLLLVPFNQLHGVVAGIPVRPAAAIPLVCGILFGRPRPGPVMQGLYIHPAQETPSHGYGNS
jgi:hypothetical protein